MNENSILWEDRGAAVAPPIRILYVHQRSTCHGGSPMVLLEMVTHLDRKRFDPLVLCPAPGELSKRLKELMVPVVFRRVTGLERRTLPRFVLEVAWYRRWLRREGIGLIHINRGGWRPSVILAARLSGIPFVQHVHNPSTDEQANSTYRWADRILAVSDQIAEPFREKCLFKAKTLTIYNGVDLSQYDTHENRRSEIPAGSGPVIGFVGQLVPRKGVLTLIEAMSKVVKTFPRAVLFLLGCDPSATSEYEQECRRLVRRLNLEPHVIFTGFCHDVAAWMRTFDVFALPTRSEPFGKVIIEAMAAGCPVVSSAVGGIPEIISRPELGTLIPPDDSEATAKAIVRYLENPELRMSVGQAASEHVRENFSLQGMMQKLEKVYSELLARP